MDSGSEDNSDTESWTSACDYFTDLNEISNYHEEVNNIDKLLELDDTKIEIEIQQIDEMGSANDHVRTHLEDDLSEVENDSKDDDFHTELLKKREFRMKLMQQKRADFEHLRNELQNQKKINEKLMNLLISNDIKVCLDDSVVEVFGKTEDAVPEISNNELRETNATLQKQLASLHLQLQMNNKEQLELSNELIALKVYIKSLKDVISASKEMIKIRDVQVDQMREKLDKIESSIAEREVALMSDDLRAEYERQLTNIRNLRLLYEERSRSQNQECENLRRQLQNKINELNVELGKIDEYEKDLQIANEKNSKLQSELIECNNELSYVQAEKKEIQSQMGVINQLFSQMLNNNGQNVDFDKLLNMLESNHGLLNEMTQNDDSMEGGHYLPKLLYDLTQNAVSVEEKEVDATEEARNNIIAEKLPKVWRVLIELLSLQNVIDPVMISDNDKCEDCYKSIPTATGGTENVISVSKTFLKLKDLIIEKKSLQKETERLKDLNTHLEKRLNSQEKRLSSVSMELTKTWHLVGKIQRQHRQLHTNEQVLRYQLQQKRRLLGELKEELEYCRKKWSSAKQKNNESEIQYKRLRMEYQQRKIDDLLSISTASPESGYSDEQISSSDDEQTLIHLNEICTDELDKVQEENIAVNVSESPIHGIAINSSTVTVQTATFKINNIEGVNPVVDYNTASSSKCSDTIHKMARAEDLMTNVNKLKPSTKLSTKARIRDPHKETAEEMFLRLTTAKVMLIDVSLTEEHAQNQNTDTSIEEEEEEEMSDMNETKIIEDTFVPSVIPATEELDPKLKEHIPAQTHIASSMPPSIQSENEKNIDSEVIITPAESLPSTSSGTKPKNNLTEIEFDYLARRDARLKRLEQQTQEFYNKLSKTVNRGDKMASHLDNIHQGYVQREKLSDEKRSKSMDCEIASTSTCSQISGTLKTKLEPVVKRAERLQNLDKESEQLLIRISAESNKCDEENSQANDSPELFSNVSDANEVHQQDLQFLDEISSADDEEVIEDTKTETDRSSDANPPDQS